MPFAGEERYREAVARAEGHEGDAAMVKVCDLKAALEEIERLRVAVAHAHRLFNADACECDDIRKWHLANEAAIEAAGIQ